MLNILVLNVGSSSVKYALFSKESCLFRGIVERIGSDSQHIHEGTKKAIKVKTHTEAIRLIIQLLEKEGIKIAAVGHRVVHGGLISETRRINSALINNLKNVAELAPLHEFPEIRGIEICSKLFRVPQVAVFDTAFHQTMPERAYTYALPSKLTSEYNIRRYGFHGINHNYMAQEACRLLKKNIRKQKIITCHLGNGCSITAINKGKSIDTSMGFTPLEGLVMGTRCGDIDPAIITFLMEHELYSTDEVEHILNKKSGLLGLSGRSNDVRELLKKNDARSKLALEVFVYRAAKYIGSYIAALDGVDIIVFSAGIGENAHQLRERILKNFGFVGLKLNKKKNKKNEIIISDSRSKVKVLAIPANEELMMAREVKKVLRK
jgi:acetate kinase